jgi:hypothetical protein
MIGVATGANVPFQQKFAAAGSTGNVTAVLPNINGRQTVGASYFSQHIRNRLSIIGHR